MPLLPSRDGKILGIFNQERLPMKTYKPPETPDDVDHLKDAIVRRVAIGDNVHVSLGGMRQTTAKCIARGKDGITVETPEGRFKVAWHHVIGRLDNDHAKPREQPETMEKAVICFRPDLLKADDDEETSLLDLIDELPRYTIESDRIELPAQNVIDTPTEFAGNPEMESRWNIALHEAGHCVAALLTGGCSGAGLERLRGRWHGIAYDEVAEGESRYSIALAGCAAECLGPWPGGFFFDQGDFIHARDELRAKRIPEREIIGKIAADLVTMTEEFAERWHKGIRELALALCRQSWVNEDQIRRILGESQAVLTKSTRPTTSRKWEDTRSIQPMAKSLTPDDKLGAMIDHAAAQDSLADASGAHAVALAETMRNRADSALAAMRGRQ